MPRHTVSDLVAALEARGLVHVSGAIDGRPGRSTHSYRLNPRAAVALAATGRGGALHAVLVDLRGTLIAEAAAPCAFDEPESVWRGLSALAHRLCADASLEMFRLRATLLLLPLEKTHDALQGQLQAALGCPVTVNSATPEGSAEPPATLEGVLERARSALLAAVVEEIEGTAGW